MQVQANKVACAGSKKNCRKLAAAKLVGLTLKAQFEINDHFLQVRKQHPFTTATPAISVYTNRIPNSMYVARVHGRTSKHLIEREKESLSCQLFRPSVF